MKDIKQIKKAPLEKVEPTKEDRRSISNKLDFSKYKFNNWKIKDDNETLNQIFFVGTIIGVVTFMAYHLL